jgi:hypothetical protein
MRATAKRSCSTCGGSTKEGFLLDRKRELQAGAQEWIEGAPETGWLGGVRTRGRAHGAVVATRCTQCGRLDLWAPELAG